MKKGRVVSFCAHGRMSCAHFINLLEGGWITGKGPAVLKKGPDGEVNDAPRKNHHIGIIWIL